MNWGDDLQNIFLPISSKIFYQTFFIRKKSLLKWIEISFKDYHL